MKVGLVIKRDIKMNRILHRLLLFVTMTCVLAPRIVHGALIPSWSALEKDLEGLNYKEFSYDEMLRSQQFQVIVGAKDLGLCYEMLEQADDPLVTLAGFNTICKQFPDDGFAAALRLLARIDQPAKELWAPVYIYLEHYWSKPEHFISVFANAMSHSWHDRAALAAVVSSAPIDLIRAWFNDKSRALSLPANEAIVVDRLYADSLNHHLPVPTALQHRLEDYAQIPGYPRLIYVCYRHPTDEIYKQTVTFVLEDDSLDDVSVIGVLSLGKKWEYIRENIDSGKLKLSEKRRQRIMAQIAKIAPK